MRLDCPSHARVPYPAILLLAMSCDGDTGMTWTAWRRLVPLLAVALAIRLGAGLYWQSRLEKQGARFAFGDSESYWTLGRAIAQGRPYQYGPDGAQIFRTPGYPLLLAPIFSVAGRQPPVILARAQSAVFGTLAVGGVWWLARELFDARAGLIAAAAASVYPGTVAISAAVLSEAPFCALMLLQFALWTAAWKVDSRVQATAAALLAGVVAGAATLVRPSWLLFTPLAVAIGFAVGGRGERADSRLPSPRSSPRGRGRHAWIGAVMLAGMVVTMVPWWVRNARVCGRFVPTTLQVGASLYDGLNPQATGASNMDLVPESVRQLRRRAASGEVPRDAALEVELDRQSRTAAWAFARNNPTRVARLAAVKLLRMWNVWPNEASFSAWPVRLAVLLSYVPVLILGTIGAAGTIRRGWPYVICWLPAVYFSVLHAIFVSSIRYRQPAMLGLIVLAAGVIASWKTDAETES
jgi:4-amino-4-deoxy-L-arabinose transferase-like glycosyltransferase